MLLIFCLRFEKKKALNFICLFANKKIRCDLFESLILKQNVILFICCNATPLDHKVFVILKTMKHLKLENFSFFATNT